MNKTYKKPIRLLTLLESFLTSWRFPVFMLSVLLFFALLVIGVMLVPSSNSVIGQFAGEFKTWCLGYNAATGEIETIYLVMFLVQPFILSIFIGFFWYDPLRNLIKTKPVRVLPYCAGALLLVLGIGLTLPALYSPSEKGELPFPAESLRTEIAPPEFRLVNQHKEEIALDNFRGNVVMITAVYASCVETCPLIIEQAKDVLGQLNEQESGQVHLLALTMDPDKDTSKMLKMTAEHYQLTEPNQHLLTGETNYVNEILDRLNIPRKRRENGTIDHANLFLLIDKTGKIAYRFTLGERQQEWLLKALRLLIEEPEPVHLSENMRG